MPSKDRRRPPSAMVLGPSRGRFCSGERRLLCVCTSTRPQTQPVGLGVPTKRCRTLQRQACQQTFKCLKWADGLDRPRQQARGKEHRQEGVGHLWDRLVRQTDPTKTQSGCNRNTHVIPVLSSSGPRGDLNPSYQDGSAAACGNPADRLGTLKRRT